MQTKEPKEEGGPTVTLGQRRATIQGGRNCDNKRKGGGKMIIEHKRPLWGRGGGAA